MSEWLAHTKADPDIRAVLEECDRIHSSKGHDYTQGRGRLANFYANGARLGLPARKVLAVYLNKHLDAIETFLRDGQVKSEPIEGRICDAINYLLLLAKMVREEERDARAEAQKQVEELPKFDVRGLRTSDIKEMG